MMHMTTCYGTLTINLLVSVFLLAHCLRRLNAMTRSANHWGRLFYVALAVGAAGVLLGPFYGYLTPQPAEVMTNIGTAGLLWGGWRYRHRRTTDTAIGAAS